MSPLRLEIWYIWGSERKHFWGWRHQGSRRFRWERWIVGCCSADKSVVPFHRIRWMGKQTWIPHCRRCFALTLPFSTSPTNYLYLEILIKSFLVFLFHLYHSILFENHTSGSPSSVSWLSASSISDSLPGFISLLSPHLPPTPWKTTLRHCP